jgi:hypothetical protein
VIRWPRCAASWEFGWIVGLGAGSAASAARESCSAAFLSLTFELASRNPAAIKPTTTKGETIASCPTALRLGAVALDLAREEIDRAHQSSIPNPTATASDPAETVAAIPKLARQLDPPERIRDPYRNPDELFELRRQTAGCRRPPVTRISEMPSDSGCSW